MLRSFANHSFNYLVNTPGIEFRVPTPPGKPGNSMSYNNYLFPSSHILAIGTVLPSHLKTRPFREFIIPLKKATLLPLSLSLPLPLPVLAQFYFLFSRKKKGILPGLIAPCYALKSNANASLQFLTPSPLNAFRLFTIPFLPFHTRYSH